MLIVDDDAHHNYYKCFTFYWWSCQAKLSFVNEIGGRPPDPKKNIEF